MSLQKKAVPDTFQSWIESQTRRRQPLKEESERKATSMPTDTMDLWLRKQQVVEKKKIEDVKFSPGSVEEWLQNQVSVRLLEQPEAKTVSESNNSAEDVQVSRVTTPESEPTNQTSENPDQQAQ